ncbi:hypothetical protein MMC24_006117 [Lignoscripta atroalba]|nr:hypothetical protein [Lignoscripta atroalba]
MGQSHSRRISTSSQTPLNPNSNPTTTAKHTNPTTAIPVPVAASATLSTSPTITAPAPPRRLRRMSELQDLGTLIRSARLEVEDDGDGDGDGDQGEGGGGGEGGRDDITRCATTTPPTTTTSTATTTRHPTTQSPSAGPEATAGPVGARARQSPPIASKRRDKPKQLLVQSPSGNILDHKTFLEYPNRPLTIAERQERIVAGVEGGRGEKDEGEGEGKEGRGGCCLGLFGRRRRKGKG